jgi:hypothetical protein
MAKKPAPLSLSQLTASLKTTDLKMNPAIQAQIEAAMSQSAPVQSPELNNNVKSLTNAIKENSIILTKGRSNSSQSADMTETEIEDEKKVKYQIRLLEKIEENKIYIKCECGNPNCFFTINAERKDVDKVLLEYRPIK